MYPNEQSNATSNGTHCGSDENYRYKKEEEKCDNITEEISINCFPPGLKPEAKFGYTMFFLLIPWPFFMYEFFTSRQYHIFVKQWREYVTEVSV